MPITPGLPDMEAMFREIITAERPALRAMTSGPASLIFGTLFSWLLKIIAFLWSRIWPLIKLVLRGIPLGVVVDILKDDSQPTPASVKVVLGSQPTVMSRALWTDGGNSADGTTRVLNGPGLRLYIDGSESRDLSQKLLRVLNHGGGL